MLDPFRGDSEEKSVKLSADLPPRARRIDRLPGAGEKAGPRGSRFPHWKHPRGRKGKRSLERGKGRREEESKKEGIRQYTGV